MSDSVCAELRCFSSLL